MTKKQKESKSSYQGKQANAAADFKVGRGKPPDEFKFKKGQPSRNPAGRPKGSRNLGTLYTEAAFAKLYMTDARTGERRRMSKIEIGLAIAANRMATGDEKALALFSAKLAQIEREAENRATQLAVSEIDHEVIQEMYRRMKAATEDKK